MKRYCKAGKTFLSLVLIGALLMQLLPFNVFAVESVGELETSSVNDEQSLDIEDTSASVLGELESERDEYVKRFAMSDGTIQAVRYEIPVHYLNDDGEWCDYNKAISETNALIDQQDVVFGEADEDYLDNPIQENDDNEGRDDKELVQEQENTSLPEEDALDERDSEIFSDGQENNFTVEQEPSDVILDEELDETANSEGLGENSERALLEKSDEAISQDNIAVKEWINISPDFSVRFSKKTNGKKFVRIEVDDHAIAWSYQNANKVEGIVESATISEDPLVLTNLQSKVSYLNAFNYADLEYVLEPESLKENIILQSASAASRYTVEYKYNDLSVVQIDSHTIEFLDTNGTSVFMLYAPYIMDASGEMSTQLSLEIQQNKKNSCIIDIIADQEWIQDSSRVFPITIDPLLVTGQAWSSSSNIQSCYISSKYPDTSYGRGGSSYEGSMYVGNSPDRGRVRSFMKVPTLPELSIGDKIVHAELAAYVTYCYPGSTVTVYQVTSDWSQSTATWNSDIQHSYLEREYQNIPAMTRTESRNDRWQRFDITDLVRGWYSGEFENYGVMLCGSGEYSSSTNHVWFLSSGYPTVSGVRPILQIYYRNMTGYENYWSYTNVDAGRNGIASVNNYNGNLTFTQPLTQDAGGNLMPVNISAIYNSTASNILYSNIGYGIQTNYHLYIGHNPNLTSTSTEEEQKYKYFLNDSDGTKHYFYFENLEGTSGQDEDGLGYTLDVNTAVSENSSTDIRYIITNKDSTKVYFNGYGNLIKIQKSTGVQATVGYDSMNRLSTIYDGAGRKYTFQYIDSSSLVSAIIDPADRITKLSYGGDTLSTITFPDGEKISLTYNANKLLTSISGIDSTSMVNIEYNLDSVFKPVATISVGDEATVLNQYSFEYRQNETNVKELSGRNYTYQFNNYGQTTGVVSNWASQAQFFEFAKGNSTDVRANKLLSESKAQYAVSNMLVNAQFASDISGYSTYATTNAYSQTWDGNYGHTGNGSYKLQKNATGTVFGIQYINVSAGTYTLSAYMSTQDKPLNGTSVLGVEVWNGNSSCDGSYRAESVSSGTGLGKWERRSVTFDVTGDRTLRVLLGAEGDTVGTIWFDDVQLESGVGESSFNLLENAGLSDGSNNWTMVNGEVYNGFGLHGFKNAIRLTGSPTDISNATQRINVSGNAGDVFSFGAWLYALSAPTDSSHHGENPNPVYQIALTYYNGNSQVGRTTVNANSNVTSVQFVGGKSIAPANYTSISYSFVYDYNILYGYYTGGYCYKEEYGQTYTYDKNGNIISSVDLSKSENQFQYSGNQMVKLVNPSGSSYSYTYDDATKLLTAATSSDGQSYEFVYDAKGNTTMAKISASKATQNIITSASYTKSQNFMATLTDQQGNISRYTYDEDRGTLQEAISPSNVVTSYTYDSNNNQLIGVSIEDQANTYSYVADKVATINIGGDIQYNYSYDLYGRLQAIAVGDTQLARYNYNSSGQCTMRDFGDNYSLRYEYDSLDRPVSQKYVLTIAAISKEIDYYKQDFFYGSNGQLSAQIDHTAKNHTKYVYDLSGRLVSERIYDTEELSNNALLQSIEYSFADKTNYLTAIRQKSSLGMQDIDFRYGNSSSGEMPDRVYDVTWNGQTLQSNIYDSFGRLTNRVIKPSTSVELNNQYSYLNGSTEGATTTLVGSLTNPMGTYVYTYDAAGNISSISDGTSRIDYQYDGLNQLIREDNQKAGYSYTYIYENGRIVSRNKYNYTRGSLGTLLGSQSWTYSETGAKPLASWKDYEVAAGGTGNTYTYSLAEPTNLGYAVGSDGSEVEYQWQGDRLWMISKTVPAANGDHNTVESSPFYDADGKRIRKNVVYRTVNADYTDFTENSTNISYFYSGDMLVGQSTDRTSLLFLYDDSNSYFGFKYNGTPYYYIKNLQDDVIGIADASGSIVVTYVYDAWGSLLDISGTLADTVGTVNPIRYRSYYYDGEVGLYYLNNRYYDPERCMFLGIDDPEVLSTTPTELTDKNLFAYCDNNPISRADDDGRFWHILVGACIGAVVNGTVQVVVNVVQQKNATDGLVVAIIGGAVSGGLSATGASAIALSAANAAISMAQNAAGQIMQDQDNGRYDFDIADMLVDGAIGAISGRQGTGSKSLTKLGVRTVVRPIRAGTSKGVRAGISEAGKAARWYLKSTKSYYKAVIKGVRSDYVQAAIIACASSKRVKNCYLHIVATLY